jgi:very-short-patch-repair endonuclease
MLPEDRTVLVHGITCANGLQTLIDLARTLTDDVWEQALESALRKRLVTIADLEEARSSLIQRVLARRPANTPATESLLETLMVQLMRTVPGFPEPVRQLEIPEAHARLDLSCPDIGLFTELDGQHHKGQPVYDARRETAIVAVTGWLPGRFTWHEVVYLPTTTARRLAALADQARRRPQGSYKADHHHGHAAPHRRAG